MQRLLPLAFAAVALVAAACGSDNGSTGPGGNGGTGSGEIVTLPRPAVFADLAKVELVSPGRAHAGLAPTFVWKAFAGAAAYRLSVLASDAPTWSWTGAETTIRYGGVEEGVAGPALRPGSWWSVAALDADDAVVAMSELRAVSPGSDLGPSPTWTKVSPTTSGSGGSEASSDPIDGSMGARICDFITTDQITAAIKGTWDAGVGETYMTGATGRCEWTSENGSLFSISVLGADSYPDGWGSDGDIDGLGEQAFYAKSVWDYRIGFVKGDVSVTLVIDYTSVDSAGFANLAQLVADQLP